MIAGPSVADVSIGGLPDEVNEEVVLSTHEIEQLPPLPASFTAAGPAVDIDLPPNARLEGPLTVSLPGLPPSSGAVPIVLHLNDLGMWEYEQAEYLDGRYLVEAHSFSIRIPGASVIGDLIDSGADWLTGRTDFPEACLSDGEEPYGWVASGSTPADGSFHACTTANPDPISGNERVEVRIKSNRSMAMWVTLPEYDHDYLWVEGLGSWGLIAPVVTELDQAFGPNRVLLPPGRSLTIGYVRPVAPGPRLDFSSYQTTTTQIVSLVYKYAGEHDVLGAVKLIVGCVLGPMASSTEDVRASDMDIQELLGCFLENALLDGADALLETQYNLLVQEGRFQLSAEAADGIEQLVDRADTVAGIRIGLARSANAAQLLGDMSSMAQDALLGFSPGLNTYTVFLVGANDDKTEEDVESNTTQDPQPSCNPDGSGTATVSSATTPSYELAVCNDGVRAVLAVRKLDDGSVVSLDVCVFVGGEYYASNGDLHYYFGADILTSEAYFVIETADGEQVVGEEVITGREEVPTGSSGIGEPVGLC